MESSKSKGGPTEAELLQSVPRKSFKQYYNLGSEKGAGSYGIVFEAVRISDDEQLAVKVIKN